jgi:hypothetical protein
MTIIPATWEAEEDHEFEVRPVKGSSDTLSQNKIKTKGLEAELKW